MGAGQGRFPDPNSKLSLYTNGKCFGIIVEEYKLKCVGHQGSVRVSMPSTDQSNLIDFE